MSLRRAPSRACPSATCGQAYPRLIRFEAARASARLLSAVILICTVLLDDVVAQAPTWTLVSTYGPVARGGLGMAHDELRHRTVMFGGYSLNGDIFFGDTWEWNGSSWAPQLLAIGPSPRRGHAMAFASGRGKTVLFGGIGSNTVLGDTWEWDGLSWTQVSTSGPSARFEHAMCNDSSRGRTVLVGGDGVPAETWEWDGANWTLTSTSGPQAQTGHAMAFDNFRARTVVHGGLQGASDTWEWDGVSWFHVSTTGPSAYFCQMTFDRARQRAVLVNRSTYGTWEWDGATWLQFATAGPGPTGRAMAGMAFDTQRQRTLLFGGFVGGLYPTVGVPYSDTWEWRGSTVHSASVFGNGCGNPPIAIAPSLASPPIIGGVARANMSNVHSSLAFVSLGLSRASLGPFALPLSLVGYGMPGCEMLQSADVAAAPATITGAGTASYSMAIPNWIGLIGLRIYLQGWAPDPGVNPGGLVASNALEWIIGS